MTTPTAVPAVDPSSPVEVAGHRLGPDAGSRRFAWGSAAGGVAAFAVLAWFATRGFSTLFDEPRFGNFFDAQARSLFDGRWDVPGDVASFERFRIGGRFYMYFGPTPALLRMPVLLLTDALDGRLGRVSMLAAMAVFVAALARLSWLARRTVRGDAPTSRGESVVAAGIILVGACGTIVPFIAGWTAVYHEAIAWGIAFALVSYGALVSWRLDGRRRDLVVAGAAAALAVLARGAVGLGPVAAIGFVLLGRVWGAVRDRRAGRPVDWPLLTGLGAALLVPVALYGYVNRAKFGALFAPPPLERQDILVDGFGARAAAMEANHSLYGWRYAPTILLHYLRPDGVDLDQLFPWVLPRIPTRVVGSAVFDSLRPAASTTATAPLALLAALGGIGVALARRSVRSVWLAPVAGTVVGTAGAVSIAIVDHRYQADFVPLLIVPGVLATWAGVHWLTGRSRALAVTAAATAVVLGAWSVWANASTALVYQRTASFFSTVDDRASLVDAQLALHDRVRGGLPSRVTTGATLPPDGSPTASLFVLGDCDGTYRSDGISWRAVEQTPATGYHEVRLRLDGDAEGRQPVLSTVDDFGSTVIWARPAPDGRVRLEYQWAPIEEGGGGEATRFVLGDVDRRADGTVDLSARLDRVDDLTTTLQLRAGDRLVHEGYVPPASGPVELGEQHALGGSAALAGRVDPLPVATPICDRLVSMGLSTDDAGAR
jgi:hypothetical protein